MLTTLQLKQSALMSCLGEGELDELIARSHIQRYAQDETIVDFEDDGADVYLVLSGQVRAILRLAVGKEVILGEFGRNELFGELSALDGGSRSANLTAIVQTEVLRIPAAVFLALVDRSPTFSRCLLKSLSQRIRGLNTRIAELSFLDTRHRLYNTLLRLSRARGPDCSQRVITPPMIHSELAEHIGASREAVSREMSRLAKEDILERTRGAIVLKMPGELSRRISATLQV